MGKKVKLQKFYPTTDIDMAKNPDSTTETPIDCVSDSNESKKSMNIINTFVRRSNRLQSIMKPHVLNKENGEMIILDDENEEDEVPVENNANVEQIDVLTKDLQGDDSCDITSANLYKNLYFDSQKKNEALTLENRELRRNMEIALGKLEVYEALVKPTAYGGPISSSGGNSESGDGVGGGGAAANESPAKKSRHDQTKKRVRFCV